MDEKLHRKKNGIEPAGRWMFVELLGHNKIAGFVSEYTQWGQTLLRIDVPAGVDTKTGKMMFTTQLYGTHALYCATPINESDAIELAKQYRPAPFSKFDLHKESNRNLDDFKISDSDEMDDMPF